MLFRVFGIYIKIRFNFIYTVKHGVSAVLTYSCYCEAV